MNTSTNFVSRYLTPERGFDLIRIYLGVGLLVRGVLFFMDPSFIGELIDAPGATSLAPRLVAIGHMLGGLLLALGLYTRLAAAVQIVPVLAALLMVHRAESLASDNQSLEFSALVLVMLVFFASFGAGSWSLDAKRKGASSGGGDAKVPLKEREI